MLVAILLAGRSRCLKGIVHLMKEMWILDLSFYLLLLEIYAFKNDKMIEYQMKIPAQVFGYLNENLIKVRKI